MGYKAFDEAEEKYQAEVTHLNAIAAHIVNSDHGVFPKTLADAWLHADSSNKRILKPAWEAIVVKYDLAKEVEE